eukprot:SAG22_NODE_237_length_14221_cov_37.207832_18_plen_35_part_00
MAGEQTASGSKLMDKIGASIQPCSVPKFRYLQVP